MTKECTFEEFMASVPGAAGAIAYANARNKADFEAESKRIKRNARRKARDQAMRDLGLVKVRGALGGAYWE